MQREKEKLAFALESGRLGSWELDLATEELSCSDLCKAIFGRTPEDSFSYADLMHSIDARDRPRVAAAMEQSLKSHSLYDVVYRVIWPSDETHWVLVRGRASTTSGEGRSAWWAFPWTSRSGSTCWKSSRNRRRSGPPGRTTCAAPTDMKD